MKDEEYIINICNQILNQTAIRQHRFDFLRGDKPKRENERIVEVLQHKGNPLPVDAFYEKLNLVIEYLEIQHFKSVKHFDKPEKLTVSNVPRNEQRKIYDERRRNVLKKERISLIEFHYEEFSHKKNGKLLRDVNDVPIIRKKLSQFLNSNNL
jgi:hypothetical protein